MTELASVLKNEISRVARKEIRAQLVSLKKVTIAQRSTIADLRKRVAGLERALKRAERANGAVARQPAPSDEDGGQGVLQRRFSATRLAQHRAKLQLSAAQYGRLAGVSGSSIYLYEKGDVRPPQAQLQRLAALRAISRPAALRALESLQTA